MIALFGNLSFLEIIVIAGLAVMIFGRDLPRVAAQVVTHVQRARRSLQKVWRESGIGEEVRQVQREIERSSSKLGQLSPHQLARNAVRDIDAEVRKPGPGAPPAEKVAAPAAEDFDGADEAPVVEPAAEASRRPPWYPETVDPLLERESPGDG